MRRRNPKLKNINLYICHINRHRKCKSRLRKLNQRSLSIQQCVFLTVMHCLISNVTWALYTAVTEQRLRRFTDVITRMLENQLHHCMVKIFNQRNQSICHLFWLTIVIVPFSIRMKHKHVVRYESGYVNGWIFHLRRLMLGASSSLFLLG